MAKLRMFANLREIAGTGRAEFEADTVAEVIRVASEEYGQEFARGVESSRIWVNGEEAGPDDRLGKGDEVVLLPPVSGGSQPAAVSTVDLLAFLPVAVAVVAVVANMQNQEIWAAALVAVIAVWAVDIGSAFSARGRRFAPLAVTTSAAAGAVAAHVLGGAGYGLAMAVAVVVGLGWAVAFEDYRRVEVFAPTVVAAVLAALGVASMVLARSSHGPDALAVDIFLVAVIAGIALGSLVARMPAVPYLDPFSTTAIVAVLGAVVAAALWDADVVGYLLVGLGIAVALVGGRGLSSMLRTGSVRLTDRSPGLVPSVDGVVLAAAIYFPLVSLIL